MDGMFWVVLIGLAAGLLANRLVKGGRFGAIVDLVGGSLGALLGFFVFRFVLYPAWGLGIAFFMAASGAALVIFDLRLLQKSLAERLIFLALRLRCNHGQRCRTLVLRKPVATGETCSVCGHKHPL